MSNDYSSNGDKDLVNSKLSVDIPPWALPKEEITLYVKLKKIFNFLKLL